MTNDNNTPTDTNVVDIFSKNKNAGQVASTKKETEPTPQTYQFRLFDGTERTVTGFLAAGPSQIMVGDEDGMLIYLAPVDSLVEVLKLHDVTVTSSVA